MLPFAEYGAHILDILKALRQTGGKDEYLDFVLKNTARYAENLKSFQAHKEARPALTKREREILMLVTEGRSNQEIAAIYRKLNVTGRATAVRKALELKIL